MAIKRVEGLPGGPWQRAMRGVLDVIVVESELLASNPLGDPSRRPLYVYRSPGVVSGDATDVASVYLIQGFSGQLDQWLARATFEPTFVERLDDLYAPEAQEACPEAVIVFVDAWTSLGGSQFLNSSATGRYLDYICDEIVPFVDSQYPTEPIAARRAIAGKSSGGYGAMVLPMLRPDIFGALVSHAGDALFELCYLPDFPKVVKRLRDDFEGSYEVFWQAVKDRTHFDFARFGDPMNMYAMAACYSPDPDRPGEVLLPFDLRTGRLIDDVWSLWLEHDPVRMAPRHAEALRGLRAIYLDAGRADEYSLDLGAQAFSDELTALGVEHSFELFTGRHGGITYRYPPAIRHILKAI
jgi:S-formylglutathione hydrolase FrmB